MRDFLEDLKFMVVVIVALIIIVSLAYICVNKGYERGDQKNYNEGVCPKCGGHYIYEHAVTHQTDTNYIYICNVCGDMIELDSYIPQERKGE